MRENRYETETDRRKIDQAEEKGKECMRMERVKWPEGKKSAVMFSFDLDGDVIWRNMSAD